MKKRYWVIAVLLVCVAAYGQRIMENVTVWSQLIVNEGGGDNDMRVEGDSIAFLWFVDASTDRIGVNTNSPQALFHVAGEILAGNTITGQANMIMNDSNTALDTQFKGVTDDDLFYIDAGNDRVGIGTATPAVMLDVAGAATFAGDVGAGVTATLGRVQALTNSGAGAAFLGGANNNAEGLPEIFSLRISNARNENPGMGWNAAFLGVNIEGDATATTNLPVMAGDSGAQDGAAAISFHPQEGAIDFWTINGAVATDPLELKMSLDDNGLNIFDDAGVTGNLDVLGVTTLGTSSNGTIFQADGFQTMTGTARARGDMNFGVEAFAPPGPGTDPALVIINNFRLVFAFEGGGGATEEIFGSFEFPPDYEDGTDLKMHIHWGASGTGAGNVLWQMDWLVTTPDDSYATPSATGDAFTADAANGTANQDQETAMKTFTDAGWERGDTFHVRLFRDSTAGSDTYEADANFLKLHVSYMRNSLGDDEQWN